MFFAGAAGEVMTKMQSRETPTGLSCSCCVERTEKIHWAEMMIKLTMFPFLLWVSALCCCCCTPATTRRHHLTAGSMAGYSFPCGRVHFRSNQSHRHRHHLEYCCCTCCCCFWRRYCCFPSRPSRPTRARERERDAWRFDNFPCFCLLLLQKKECLLEGRKVSKPQKQGQSQPTDCNV